MARWAAAPALMIRHVADNQWIDGPALHFPTSSPS
jgi:hypothetical protein